MTKLQLFIIIFLIISISVFSQSDSSKYIMNELHKSHPEYFTGLDSEDSVKFRFWISGDYVSGLFVEILIKANGQLAFQRGFVDYESDSIFIMNKVKHKPNLTEILQLLKSNDINNLQSQNDASIILVKENRKWQTNDSTKLVLINKVKGDYIIVEIFNKNQYRTFDYHAPIEVYELCQSNNLICKEHEKMKNIVESLYQSFDLQQLARNMLINRYKR